MLEETGNFSSGCPGLYTQIFRARTGSWSGAYTVYSIFQGPGRLLVPSVYSKLEKPGPGQNLYTRKFRAQADSWSIAYTRYSKSLGPGEICILKNLEPGQVPGLGRIQKARKAQIRAESVYSNFQDLGRLLVDSVYRKLENLGPRAEPVYSKIQGPDRFRVPSVYSLLEEPGSGQNQYPQKIRAQARSWSLAYTESSKSPDPGRTCILEFSESGQVPGS